MVSHSAVRSIVSAQAQQIYEKRYLLKDEYGKPQETIDELLMRVAKAISQRRPGRQSKKATNREHY